MRSLFLSVIFCISAGFYGLAAAAENANPVVIMETSMGTVKIELWADKAPITVENFLRYTDNKFYDGLIFHRVIPSFMVQGGGYNAELVEQTTSEPIKNEATAELTNRRGTLAMARTQVVDSASSQFFINLVDNNFLNHTDETARGFGYAVFGEVIEGMDIVDLMAAVPTGSQKGHQDVPLEPLVITSIVRE